MTTSKKQFKAHLIKYRPTEGSKVFWFWVNPNSGTTISPYFNSQSSAESWFDDLLVVHNETCDLLDRVKNGSFYSIRGRVDVGEVISSMSAASCPFTIHLEDDIIEAEVLATSRADAKKRVEDFFEILEWIE
jgi:hypothetical protein